MLVASNSLKLPPSSEAARARTQPAGSGSRVGSAMGVSVGLAVAARKRRGRVGRRCGEGGCPAPGLRPSEGLSVTLGTAAVALKKVHPRTVVRMAPATRPNANAPQRGPLSELRDCRTLRIG